MFNFTPDNFINALPIMGQGVFGIFVVMAVIYAVIAILQAASNK